MKIISWVKPILCQTCSRSLGFGHSERIIGEAIQDRRDQVVLAGKCGLVWRQAGGEFFFASTEATISSFDESDQAGSRKAYRCLRHEAIRAACNAWAWITLISCRHSWN